MKRATQAELLASITEHIAPPSIVAERFAQDLVTQRDDTDHALDNVGCIFDSGSGRCDGAYQHKGKLHYRLVGETWESPW